jgi:hypothetical protein
MSFTYYHQSRLLNSSGKGLYMQLLSAMFSGIDLKDGIIVLVPRHGFCTDCQDMGSAYI